MSRRPAFDLRRLKPNAVRLGLLQRLADLDDLAVEIDAVPAQRQHLAEAHAGEQRHHGRDVKAASRAACSTRPGTSCTMTISLVVDLGRRSGACRHS